MADSSYMLGLNRDEITVDGVKTIQITQAAYITELYEAFKDQMPSRCGVGAVRVERASERAVSEG